MDFIEYAKWGIRVKEEPGTLGPLYRDKPTENEIGGLQSGWMCKFPCDAQGVLDTSASTTHVPHELLEPFEPSPASYLEDGYFNLQDSDKFTGCTLPEGNNNIPQDNPAHIIQQDESMKDYAVFRSSLEENNAITSLASSKESLKDYEKQMLNAVLNVQYDISKDLVPSADQVKRRDIVQHMPKSTFSKRPNDQSFMVKNQNEILCPSDMELLFEGPEDAVVQLVKNTGRIEMSLNVEDNQPRGVESLTEEGIVTAHQENSRKENNNDFRISEISSFECPDCGEILKSFNGFITHMNSHIIEQHENIDTVQCENCNEKFSDEKSLSHHTEECNSGKESNMPSPKKQNNNNDNSKNVVCVSVNCSETNSSVKQCAPGDNSELTFSSHCQETSQKKCPKQQRHHKALSSCSPKRRRQAFTEECSSSEVSKSRNNWTVQNLGAADGAFDVSWSSEIKCRDEREGRSVGSVRTLSLRLFRFRRPKVVVKRAQVPLRSESVIKTLNSCVGDSVSNNTINEKSVCRVENVAKLKQLTNEPVTREVNKIPKFDSKLVSRSNIVEPSRKPNCVLRSEKECPFARQHELTDGEKCCSPGNLTLEHSSLQNMQSEFSDTPCSLSVKIPEKDKKSDEPDVNASSKFPTEDTKVRSNLKIKIKPVVVLDRLSTFNFNSNKFSHENTSKSVGDVSSQKQLPRRMNNTVDSNALETCEIPSVETNCRKLVKTFVDQSVRHFDLCHNAISQRENANSLADLEKRYGLKKCYVKLKRISVEPCNSRKTVKHNREETDCETKTCGKIKLRRMSSKLWTVSSCTSALEKTDVTEDIEDRMKNASCVAKESEQNGSDQDACNKIYNQRSKKCVDINDPSISVCESPEIALNYIQRGKHVKRFRSVCACCQKVCVDEQDLAQHLETHLTGYKCPNCSARFHFVMELDAHVAGCSLASLLDCHEPGSLIKPCQVVL